MITLFFLLWSSVSWADIVEDENVAEIYRLRSKLEKYYQHETWTAVNSTYEEMLQFKKKEKASVLTVEDHLKGAMASSSLGNIEETLRRLEAAVAIEETSSAVQWREMLNTESGPVSLSAKADASLQYQDSAFYPEMMLAVDFANRRLDEDGSFRGRLPVGSYTYGKLRFTVTTDGILKEKKQKEVSTTSSPKVNSRSLVVLGAGVLDWGPSEIGTAGPIPFTGGSLLLGWDKVFHFQNNVLVGVAPQIQITGHPTGGVIGFLPYVYAGWQGRSFFCTFGGVQQTYLISQTGFVMSDGQELPEHRDSGYSLGWGGSARMGWMLSDRYGVFAQGIYGSDGIRWISSGAIGAQRAF